MREIILETAGVRSVIRCGAGAFEKFAPEIDGKVFVVTDTNVYRIYGGLIERTFKGAPVKVIPAGEKSKNGRRLFDIVGIFPGLLFLPGLVRHGRRAGG